MGDTDNDDYLREMYKATSRNLDEVNGILERTMAELERQGTADFVLLKDDVAREWWNARKAVRAKEAERVAKAERKERLVKEAMARLSSDEIEALGLNRIAKRKKFTIDDLEYEAGVEEGSNWGTWSS